MCEQQRGDSGGARIVTMQRGRGMAVTRDGRRGEGGGVDRQQRGQPGRMVAWADSTGTVATQGGR